jgi:hypothetical protein
MSTTQTGEDGVFRFHPLTMPSFYEGRLWLIAQSQDSRVGSELMGQERLELLKPGEPRIMLTVIPPHRGRLSVADLPANGKPEQALVSVASVDRPSDETSKPVSACRFPPGFLLPGLHARCAPDGSYSISGTGGEVTEESVARVFLNSSGCAAGPYDVDRSSSEFDLKPLRARTVVGRLVSNARAVMPSSLTAVLIARGPSSGSAATDVESDGSFRFENVPPGDCTIEFSKDTGHFHRS